MRSMRWSVLGAVLALAVVAGAAPAEAVATAGVVGPTIVVTPATGLLDGQSVSVTGSGFSGDVTTVGIVQCSAPNQCTSQVAVPASAGSFSTTVTVTRLGLGVDCATAPGTCQLAAANLDGGGGGFDEVAIAPLDFEALVTVPTAPRQASAVAGGAAATVSWTAPASTGGSPITGYWVSSYVGYFPVGLTKFASTATTQVITGLTNGTTHWFRVRAVNVAGTSAFSNGTNLITPVAALPGAPTGASALVGDGQATVSWTAPVSDGGTPITGYWVNAYVGYFPVALLRFSSTATTQVVTGLTNGTTVWFRVRAVNAVGRSGYSNGTNLVTPPG